MLKPIDISKAELDIGVVQKFEKVANGKSLGDIAVMKDGRVFATICKQMEGIKQAERWLALI